MKSKATKLYFNGAIKICLIKYQNKAHIFTPHFHLAKSLELPDEDLSNECMRTAWRLHGHCMTTDQKLPDHLPAWLQQNVLAGAN